MNYKVFLEQVAHNVTSMFGGHADSGLPYHNKAHTQFVVDSAIQIANHYQLSDGDFFVVVTAAWFHDTGYLKTRDHHERECVKVADNYLRKLGIDQETIARVNQCIMATEMPQKTQNLLEEKICDADMFHFGADNFSEKYKSLRKEIE